MTASDCLEMVDKCIIDDSASNGPDHGDGLGRYFLGDDKSEPSGDLGDQPHEYWASFLNDPALSDEACSFRDGFSQNSTDKEIIAIRCTVGLRSTAEPKDL